jgi:hypothetical protein
MAIDIAMYAGRSSIAAIALVLASCGGRAKIEQSPDSVTGGTQESSPEQQTSSGTGTAVTGSSSTANGVIVATMAPPPPPFDAGSVVVVDAGVADVYVLFEVHDAASGATREAAPNVPPPCTDLVVTGTPVRDLEVVGPAPNLGLGGTIIDGVYDMTQFTRYLSSSPGTSGPGEREVIRISKSGTLLEYRSDGVPNGMVISLAPQGAVLNYTELCPNFDDNMFIGPFYTAAGDEFISQNAYYQKVFKKRP